MTDFKDWFWLGFRHLCIESIDSVATETSLQDLDTNQDPSEVYFYLDLILNPAIQLPNSPFALLDIQQGIMM